MHHRPCKIVHAWLETPSSGTIELSRDWRNKEKPDLHLHGGMTFSSLERMRDEDYGRKCGYFLGAHGMIYFIQFMSQHDKEVDSAIDKVYLAGDFNGWQYGVGNPEWELNAATVDGELAYVWTGHAQRFLDSPGFRFKFVTESHHWLPVNTEAYNVVRDDAGNQNYFFDPERTGYHLYSFKLESSIDLSKAWRIEWGKGLGDGVPLRPDGFFFQLKSDLPLGAIAREKETVFRLFAPRATSVVLCVSDSVDRQGNSHRYSLVRRPEPVERMKEIMYAMPSVIPRSDKGRLVAPKNWQGVWEITLDHNLHGWFYWYEVEGPEDCFGTFSKNQRVLDPYALACAGREGPGIILSRSFFGKPDHSFKTPVWQDLVIAEAHVRDLLRHAPLVLDASERRGFNGLKKWVESSDFYLQKLGINCVELQPVHENDSLSSEEYHWGYMPVNWFAPASTYASKVSDGSAVREFKDLVAAFHKRGMAVVIDVVFNHQGVPAHLMFIDKQYYFVTDNEGHLSNWSGCGNDYRASSAMAKRLIIDSCAHMIEAFGVDGFRFDLAELLGADVLREVERSLKTIKSDVILIAEPWSFRGHIAGELGDTGWSSWNDGYRNFMRDYIRGGGSASQLEYFLKGSPWYFARWPAQTVNYTESHDDRVWIDVITENGNGSGFHPTALDRRRTHLMVASLFVSLGIPMISSGQDFLRSKHGVNNTYLRGDLNGLDYRRIQSFPGTHAYFADWIAFRLSERGRLLRQWSCPKDGFFRSFSRGDSSALALLYNADGSQGPERLLFAINPTVSDVSLPVDRELVSLPWTQIADQERFDVRGVHGMIAPVTAPLPVNALSCSLWIS